MQRGRLAQNTCQKPIVTCTGAKLSQAAARHIGFKKGSTNIETLPRPVSTDSCHISANRPNPLPYTAHTASEISNHIETIDDTLRGCLHYVK